MMENTFSIARKEFTDAITSRRVWLITGILLLFSIASTYAETFGFRIGEEEVRMPMLQIASRIASTTVYMAPLLGIALAFDAVSGEREHGTLKLLLSRPIYREDVINGKIISALAVIGLAITVSLFASVSVSILLHNVTVTLDDIARICVFIVFSIILSFAFYALSLFTSTFLKSGHSLVVGIGIWIFFTFILPILSRFIVAVVLGPPPLPFQPGVGFNGTPTGGGFGNVTFRPSKEFLNYMKKVREISSTIHAFSINHHYTEIIDLLFSFVIGPSGYEPSVPTPITTVLSTRMINIAVLTVFPIIFLIASYMVFTRRQEK